MNTESPTPEDSAHENSALENSGPENSAPENSAIDLVVACSRFIRFARRRAEIDESPAVWRALAILNEGGPMRVSDFARRDRLSQPSATAMLRRLKGEGLIESRPDPADGRASLCALSDAGRQRLIDRRTTMGQKLESVLASLEPDQRAELARAVHTMNMLVTLHDPDRADAAADRDVQTSNSSSTSKN